MDVRAFIFGLFLCFATFGKAVVLHATEPLTQESLEQMIQEAQDPLTRSVFQGVQVSWQLKQKLEQPLVDKNTQLGEHNLHLSSGLQIQATQVQAGLKINF